MKAYYYISIVVVLTLGSCNSALYTGAEYDDLYYQPSDRPLSEVKSSPNYQINEGSLKAQDYYDNIYAADTLVSEEYSDAVDYDDAITSNNYYNGSYDYIDNYSYTGRLRRFYGNYFDPYWRDPFYSGFNSPFGYSFGYSGFPYSNYYNPYSYNSFYSDYYGGYYGGYSGGYYGGMGGFYNPYYYGSYYNSFYSPYNYYSGIHIRDGVNSVPYGRRERQSNLSSNWNSIAGSGSSRRDSYLSTGGSSNVTRRSSSTSQPISSDARRTNAGVNAQQPVNADNRRSVQDNSMKSGNTTSGESTPRSSTRPEYNSVNRTYTPSYNNPRLSTRPSFNNSRVPAETNQGGDQNTRYINTNRSNSNNNSNSNSSTNQGQPIRNQNTYRSAPENVRTAPSVSPGQGRYVPSNRSIQNNYSAPSRRSSESSSGSSSGSYNSRSSSSYSSGSSSSGSGGSYSSGSSSSSSGSSRSSSGSSSGTRR